MRYLNEEWIQAANQAIQDATAPNDAGPMVIDQHIDNVMSYRIVIDGSNSSITQIGAADGPTAANAVFHQDWDTAIAVATGTTDAHQAFLLGHIRFVGDVNVLIERRAAFDWLATALEPVMAATTFD